jgi:hypothetical protein
MEREYFGQAKPAKMNTHNIVYSNPERAEHIHGVALPIFIHNGGYHLSTKAQEIFDNLNPQHNNLLDLAARRKKIASEENLPEEQIWQTRLGTRVNIYRLSDDGQEIYGDEVPLFFVQDGEFQLKRCFVYQDRQVQLEYSGALLPVDTIREMLDSGVLMTSVPNGAQITMPGLGRFQAMDSLWCTEPQERWREILNLIAVLNGEPDAIEVCYQAFLKYRADPIKVNRDLLRTAYEAVPEHQRIYTQRSMDNKDHDIRSFCMAQPATAMTNSPV